MLDLGHIALMAKGSTGQHHTPPAEGPKCGKMTTPCSHGTKSRLSGKARVQNGVCHPIATGSGLRFSALVFR